MPFRFRFFFFWGRSPAHLCCSLRRLFCRSSTAGIKTRWPLSIRWPRPCSLAPSPPCTAAITKAWATCAPRRFQRLRRPSASLSSAFRLPASSCTVLWRNTAQRAPYSVPPSHRRNTPVPPLFRGRQPRRFWASQWVPSSAFWFSGSPTGCGATASRASSWRAPRLPPGGRRLLRRSCAQPCRLRSARWPSIFPAWWTRRSFRTG